MAFLFLSQRGVATVLRFPPPTFGTFCKGFHKKSLFFSIFAPPPSVSPPFLSFSVRACFRSVTHLGCIWRSFRPCYAYSLDELCRPATQWAAVNTCLGPNRSRCNYHSEHWQKKHVMVLDIQLAQWAAFNTCLGPRSVVLYHDNICKHSGSTHALVLGQDTISTVSIGKNESWSWI